MSDIISPGQIDDVIELVTRHGTAWILFFVVFSMFVENLFPPYPGDAVIFAAGFISGAGKLSVVLVLLLSIVASLASIMVVYTLGNRYGKRILRWRIFRGSSENRMSKIENWFSKYGPAVLVASRFLAGTRSLIALTAGIGSVKPVSMTIFSGISVILWNSLLIFSAYYLKSNYEMVYEVFATYNKVVFIVVALIVIFFAGKFLLRGRASK